MYVTDAFKLSIRQLIPPNFIVVFIHIFADSNVLGNSKQITNSI